VLVYFFFKVKNDLRFGSSFCEVAGRVWDLLAATAVESLWAFREVTHWDISVSSWACSKNKAPLASLQEGGEDTRYIIKTLYRITKIF